MIILPNKFVKKCDDWAEELLRKGLSDYARAQASHGIEGDFGGQALAKAAEIIFCIDVGIDPEKELLWRVLKKHEKKPHHDVIFGLRIDIKESWIDAQYLIWAINKIKDFPTREIDALALVKVHRLGDAIKGYTKGWVRKERFEREHFVVPKDFIVRLQPGTWAMHEDKLDPIALLP